MDDKVLQRRIKREIAARKEAEEISEKKISQLYLLTQRLKKTVQLQKQSTKKLKQQIKKTKEEAVAKSTLQTILESSVEYSIIAINRKGKILLWNEGAKRNYRYSSEELVNNETIYRLYTPEDIESGNIKAFFTIAYREGKAEGEFKTIRKDGTQFIATVTATVHRNTEGKCIGFVVISKDITKAKEMEDQLIKSNEQLEEFAYITSHDLKAPLRAITQLSTWIEEDSLDVLNDECKKNLALLRARTSRMTNMIEGILQYSRAGRLNLEIDKVNCRELLEEIIETLNQDEKFKITLKGNFPTFFAAKIPLTQVFSNLINNSMKHHDKERGRIIIAVKDLGIFYEFSVADDGPGIDPLYFENIFKMFQTLKSRDELEATGIGLSVVKKIVESQGGHIRVYSAAGKGAKFTFTWPKKTVMTGI